jgi:acyl carrier protein
MARSAKIIEAAREVLGPDVSGETSMATCPKWDSLQTLQIIMALDEAGISIPFEKIADIHSVRDIVEIAG